MPWYKVERKMRVRGEHRAVGDLVELDEAQGREYTQAGTVSPAERPAKPPVVSTSSTSAAPAEGVEAPEQQPKRRTRGRA